MGVREEVYTFKAGPNGEQILDAVVTTDTRTIEEVRAQAVDYIRTTRAKFLRLSQDEWHEEIELDGVPSAEMDHHRKHVRATLNSLIAAVTATDNLRDFDSLNFDAAIGDLAVEYFPNTVGQTNWLLPKLKAEPVKHMPDQIPEVPPKPPGEPPEPGKPDDPPVVEPQKGKVPR